MLTKEQIKPGFKVYANGDYPGVVVREYSEGMVEVRLPGGLTCIPKEDARPR